MDASDRKRWLRAVLLLGVLYLVIGLAFGAFARWAAFNSTPENWNRLAFVACGIAFAIHVGYEHFRLRNSPRITAWHASLAVALGALGLALSANLHDLWSPAGYRPRMLIALIAWPLLTAVPAFIVALVAAAVLNFKRRTA